MTTYGYDHRNRLIETEIGEAATTNLGTVTPLVKLDGQGETQPPVALFRSGDVVPAGRYAIEYVSGAIDYTGSTTADDWTVNHDFTTYRYVIVSGTQPFIQAPARATSTRPSRRPRRPARVRRSRSTTRAGRWACSCATRSSATTPAGRRSAS